MSIIIGPLWGESISDQANKSESVSMPCCHQVMCVYGSHGLLNSYIELRVAHAPGVWGTFSPPPRVSDPDMHHGTCVTHVPWCMPGSLTSGFHWSLWRGKRSRHSRRMRNPQLYVSVEALGCWVHMVHNGLACYSAAYAHMQPYIVLSDKWS